MSQEIQNIDVPLKKPTPLGRETLDDVARAEAEGMMSHPEHPDPIAEAVKVQDHLERQAAKTETNSRLPWTWIAAGIALAAWFLGFVGIGAGTWIHAFLAVGLLLVLLGVLGWGEETVGRGPAG